MTDNELFEHFLKKVYEVLHLHYKHYMPQGKPEPILYRDVFYHLYKIYDSGVLEELSKEPILEAEVKQLDMLASLFEIENKTNWQISPNGTILDKYNLIEDNKKRHIFVKDNEYKQEYPDQVAGKCLVPVT